MRALAALLFLLQEPASEAEFRKLHQDLQPPGNETWKTIPWKISLLEAGEAAAREKKPIFVWAMHGHPLGSC